MQATEHGSLHNPVSDRQSVSVLVGWHALLGGSGRPGVGSQNVARAARGIT